MRLDRGDDRVAGGTRARPEDDGDIEPGGDDPIVGDRLRSGEDDHEAEQRRMLQHDADEAIAVGEAQPIGRGDAVLLGEEALECVGRGHCVAARIVGRILLQRLDRGLEDGRRGGYDIGWRLRGDRRGADRPRGHGKWDIAGDRHRDFLARSRCR